MRGHYDLIISIAILEDSAAGVRAGKAAGMTVWGFVGGSHRGDRDGEQLLTAVGADRMLVDVAGREQI